MRTYTLVALIMGSLAASGASAAVAPELAAQLGKTLTPLGAEWAGNADGSIPADQQEVLLEIGGWLDRYGEAIYGTRPWYTFGEGPTREPEKENHGTFNNLSYTARDIRYTTSGTTVYALFLGAPEEGSEIVLESFSAQCSGCDIRVEDVSMAGGGQALEWVLDDQGLKVRIPSAGLDPMSTVLKIETKEE